jgi:broad specificity phosphatase PhoE
VKQIYYLRHGESEFNKAGKWAGSSDIPLTAKGREQAKAAGAEARKQGLAFDIIVSSPLERAHHTAKHFATELNYPHENIILTPLLVERHFGELEGTNNLLMRAKYLIDESVVDKHGAEKLVDVQRRAQEALAYLHSLPAENILVVGHGAFGRALRRAINKEPLHRRGTSYDNAKLVKLV